MPHEPQRSLTARTIHYAAIFVVLVLQLTAVNGQSPARDGAVELIGNSSGPEVKPPARAAP